MTENNYVRKNTPLLEKLPGIFKDLERHFLKRAGARYGLPAQDAYDVAQQAYLDVQKRVSQSEFIEVGSGLRGLALTVFDRRCKDYLESRGRVKFVEINDQIFFGEGILDDVSNREALRIITEHIDELPEHYKLAISHQINGTYDGKTDGTHRSRVMRARKMLRKSLSEAGILETDVEVD